MDRFIEESEDSRRAPIDFVGAVFTFLGDMVRTVVWVTIGITVVWAMGELFQYTVYPFMDQAQNYALDHDVFRIDQDR